MSLVRLASCRNLLKPRGSCVARLYGDKPLPGVVSEGRKLAIVFTCESCSTRSAKQLSEQAYNHGVVIVRCSGCNVDHLIADRLGLFEDGNWDIEKAMSKKGNFRRVTNDDVFELTTEDIIGKTPLK